MKDFVLVIAAIYGMLAVIFGAFGAHALKEKLKPKQLSSFETGVRYQMFHALVLLIIGLQIPFEINGAGLTAWFFIVGTFLFSFSIYGLILSGMNGKKWRFLGPITPLGGLGLIAGWVSLIFVLLKL